MNKYLFFVLILLNIGCYEQGSSDEQATIVNLENEELIDTSATIKNEIDSIVIFYFNSYSAYNYKLLYYYDSITIHSPLSTTININNDRKIVNNLLKNISVLFLNKEIPIILSKEELEDFPIYTRDYIEIAIYKGDQQMVNYNTSIGEEGYRILYSDEFVDLFNLVIELCNEEYPLKVNLID